jgi:glycosyltransferase involved in cell wall biosynthesis
MLSAIIITLNEENNIGRCLVSLKGVADEVLVIDSGSTDATSSICRENGAIVIETEWKGYAATKNFGNDQAKGDVILSIDADEVLSEQLRASILKEKERGFSGAYSFNRLSSYCGKWVRYCGWYPDTKIRIFPKGEAHWEGEFVHEKLCIKDSVSLYHIHGDLLHYTYHTISEHRDQIERYSTLHAQQMRSEGRQCGLVKMLIAPIFKFFKTYILKLGIFDGVTGLLISYYSAKAVYLKYWKAYSLRLQDRK